MANGIRTGDPRGFNKRCSSKFREGSRVRQTLEEGHRTYRPKRCGNSNKDEDNSPKTLNDKSPGTILKIDKGGTKTNKPRAKEIDVDSQGLTLECSYYRYVLKEEKEDSLVLKIAEMHRFEKSKNALKRAEKG